MSRLRPAIPWFRLAPVISIAGGDVTGPASATDNAIARFDGIGGKTLQNSGVIIDDTNNITGVGTISSGAITSTGASSFGSIALTTDLAVADGGTGVSTFAVNGILYGNTATNILVTAAAASSVLVTSGANVPSLSTDIPTAVTIGAAYIYRVSGTDVSLADGGTNASLTASNGGIFYSTATAGAILAGTATAGQLLQSGSSAAPIWTTSTYPATNAANTLLYASSANVMAALATAASGVLVTSAGSVPSIATDIPTAVTIGTAYIYRVSGTDVAIADGGTAASDAATAFTNLKQNATATATGVVELATTAEIDTGTDTTRAIPIDQFVASARNVRYFLYRVVEATTDTAVATTKGGDLEIPITGTITEIGAYVDTAGTTGTMTIDVNKNGTTLMTTNKITIDTAEKSSRTAATAPALTTTSIAAGDLITIDIDAIHTTAAKGLTVRLGIRLS